jgi:hypothetical protein
VSEQRRKNNLGFFSSSLLLELDIECCANVLTFVLSSPLDRNWHNTFFNENWVEFGKKLEKKNINKIVEFI